MTNKNTLGILLVVFAMFVFAIQDSITKYIYKEISLYEMYLIRSLVSLLILIFYLKITNKAIIFKTHYPILTIIRVILFFFGFSSFYISLVVMPLATATALFFCSPFIITIFARFILKEDVGIQRWMAVVVGFIGAYIILNPDFSNFDYLKLLPIFCAFCYATSMIIIRKTSEKDNVYSQILQFHVAGILISVIFYFFFGEGQLNTIDHPATQFLFRKWFTNLKFSLPYMVIIGVVAAGAFLSLFTAYRIASPSVISPFEYTILIWVTLSGWFIFGEIPNLRTFVGIFLITGGGVFIFFREKVKDQNVVTEKTAKVIIFFNFLVKNKLSFSNFDKFLLIVSFIR